MAPDLRPLPEAMSGEGRVALVSGGAGAIGSSICQRLAQIGFAVLVADVEAAAAERVAARCQAEGVQAAACVADLAQPEEARRVVSTAVEQLGGLHVVVNCVGGAGPPRSLTALTLDDWEQVMTLNARTLFLLVQAATPPLVEQGYGRLIALGSQSAWVGGVIRTEQQRAASVHYAASKGAVVSFMRAVAMELAEHGVTANVISPATVETAKLRANRPDLGAFMKSYPVHRVGQPNDVAHAVAYLATDPGFVTGTTLHVAGGLVLS